jgi:hypothetical protein
MQIDPAFEFRRLAEEYRAKTDDELRELAADFTDLTEPAQQALRQEMQSRRLGDPGEVSASSSDAHSEPQAANAPSQFECSTRDIRESIPVLTDPILGDLARSPKIVPDEPDGDSDEDTTGQHEYTWKTMLCECETADQAQELSEALQQAGLDSWVQGSREFGLRYARVLVAADQLEQARAIAARPIPKEIIDESKDDVPEFTPPVCPKCGAGDPVLEAVDPENTWRCEQCGAQWTDPAEVADAKEERAGELPS